MSSIGSPIVESSQSIIAASRAGGSCLNIMLAVPDVAVDDADVLGRRSVGAQPFLDDIIAFQLASLIPVALLVRGELAGPAIDLAGEEIARLAVVAKAHRLVIDIAQRDQPVDDGEGDEVLVR